MGLDVALYTNISIADSDEPDFIAYVNDEEFEDRIKNLINGGYYRGDRSKTSVSCGYSTHNKFRGALLNLIGRYDLTNGDKPNFAVINEFTDIPFIELVNFADNEGCIDWQSCGELAIDFNNWYNRAQKTLVGNMLDLYNDWHAIINEASNNRGVLIFR